MWKRHDELKFRVRSSSSSSGEFVLFGPLSKMFTAQLHEYCGVALRQVLPNDTYDSLLRVNVRISNITFGNTEVSSPQEKGVQDLQPNFFLL